MRKRIRKKQAGRLSDLIAVILTAAAALVIVLTLCGNRIYVVRSGSMEPAIRTGSAVVVNEKAGMDKIETGDVICFQASNGVPVIHRAVAVTADGIETKGDANQTADAVTVGGENYTGKVVFYLPLAGYAVGFLASARGRILLLTALAVLIILWAFRKSSRRAVAAMLVVSLVAAGSFSSGISAQAADLKRNSVTENGSEDRTAEAAEKAGNAVSGETTDESGTETENDFAVGPEEEIGRDIREETKDDSMNGTEEDSGNDTGEETAEDPGNGAGEEAEEDSGSDSGEEAAEDTGSDDGEGEPGDIPGKEDPDEPGDEPAGESENGTEEEKTEDPDEGSGGASENEPADDEQEEPSEESTAGGEEEDEEDPDAPEEESGSTETEEEEGTGGDQEIRTDEDEKEESAEIPKRAASESEYTATVRYRANGGTILRDVSQKTQYAVGTDIGKNNTLIYKSTDYGSTWAALKTLVTPSDASADLINVATIGLTMTGYYITSATAYNSRADQTGTVFCQNGKERNAVTTKRLNGGTEITEDITVDLYVNWETQLILDANGGAVWGDPSAATVDAGTIYYGSTYYLINRLSDRYPEIDSSYIQAVPNFYREGYVFDGWNTDPAHVSSYGETSGLETQYGRGDRVSFRRLAGDGTGGDAGTRLYAQWIRREGIDGTLTLANGATITNEDPFGRNSITGIELTIPFSVSAQKASDYLASSDADGFVWMENGNQGHFYYMNGISPQTGPVSIPGSLNLRLNNRAYDNAGTFYDVSITVSDIVINPQKGGTYISYEPGDLYLFGYNLSSGIVQSVVYGNKHAGASYTISIRILRHGTDTEITGKKALMYFQDLDVMDISSLTAKYRYVLNDSGIAPYAEAITVPVGMSSEFYVKDGENSIIARVENGATRITGGEYTGTESSNNGQITPGGTKFYQGIPMSEVEYTAVAFPVTSGNISFSWSGSYCGTQLFASPASGKIRIVKTSTDESITEGNAGYDLSGAAFGIYSDEESARNAALGGAENGNELAVLLTDSSGITPFSQKLTLGIYYIAELSAPHGYERSREVQAVQIDSDGMEAEVSVRDRPLLDTIGVLLQKTDGDGKMLPEEYAANLSGAEFSLTYYKSFATGTAGLESLLPDRCWQLWTNGIGAVDFSEESCAVSGDPLFYNTEGKPAFPAGTLVIAETEAPPGFERNEEIFLLTIEFDEEGRAVRKLYDEEGNSLGAEMTVTSSLEDVGLKIKETVSFIDLTLEKRIEREDLHPEHGEVNFAFEVTGHDLTGAEHTFHQVIRFAGEEPGEGTVSDSVTIGIPAGTYTITELETDRYSLVDLEALTENLSAVKENSGMSIGTIQPVSGFLYGTLTEDAAAAFTNRKTDWGGFSHASSAVNHIGG